MSKKAPVKKEEAPAAAAPVAAAEDSVSSKTSKS